MRSILISIWLICAASTSHAQQRDTATAALTPAEVQTLNKLHASNLKEIAAGKLATNHARNESVKHYGQELVDHHSKADREVQALAAHAGVKLSQQQPKSELSGLKKNKNPATFDRAFLDEMSDDHEAAIAQVREAQGSAVNPELQNMLKELLPILEQHRSQAVQLLQNNAF